jgi:GNAT superfamily N-acetyltransferase
VTEVRAAVQADARDVARLQVRSWQSAYRGLIAQEYLDGLSPEVFADRYTFGRVGLRMPSTLIAVDGPAHVRTGVGRLLITAARERLRLVGVTGALLWVLDGNVRARRFYERDGWKLDGACRTVTFGNATVKQVRYRCAPV